MSLKRVHMNQLAYAHVIFFSPKHTVVLLIKKKKTYSCPFESANFFFDLPQGHIFLTYVEAKSPWSSISIYFDPQVHLNFGHTFQYRMHHPDYIYSTGFSKPSVIIASKELNNWILNITERCPL